MSVELPRREGDAMRFWRDGGGGNRTRARFQPSGSQRQLQQGRFEDARRRSTPAHLVSST
jgi:hypothetical protein